MNAVGIDVSKGRSTVCIMQPLGVVIAEPYDVSHNAQELKELAERLKLLSDETKVVMEYTDVYLLNLQSDKPRKFGKTSPQCGENVAVSDIKVRQKPSSTVRQLRIHVNFYSLPDSAKFKIL